MKKRPPFYIPNWNARFGQINVSLEAPGLALYGGLGLAGGITHLCDGPESGSGKKRGETF
ncbi:MAG: hypothetical protein CM15mP9_0370 [Methanobacteriota archaeon]|nr:MAG: hypothetical protein CM15mP9_0370 [Euryarchaeota archaeon]